MRALPRNGTPAPSASRSRQGRDSGFPTTSLFPASSFSTVLSPSVCLMAPSGSSPSPLGPLTFSSSRHPAPDLVDTHPCSGPPAAPVFSGAELGAIYAVLYRGKEKTLGYHHIVKYLRRKQVQPGWNIVFNAGFNVLN